MIFKQFCEPQGSCCDIIWPWVKGIDAAFKTENLFVTKDFIPIPTIILILFFQYVGNMDFYKLPYFCLYKSVVCNLRSQMMSVYVFQWLLSCYYIYKTCFCKEVFIIIIFLLKNCDCLFFPSLSRKTPIFIIYIFFENAKNYYVSVIHIVTHSISTHLSC